MASSNTSKTAHVMNLLSKNRPAAAAAEAPAKPKEEASAPPQAEEAEPARTAPVAPMISSINADAAVSTQIKDALEAELEAAALAPAQDPIQEEAPVQQEAAPVQEAAPIQKTVTVQKAAPVQETVPAQEAAPVQETVTVQKAAPVQEAAPVQKAAPVQEAAPVQPAPQEPPAEEIPMDLPAQEEPSAGEASYINVMQILVEEKADEYMKMFGICCCDQCRVDVRAYALNHLPPKYVVLSGHERVPRLTVYESRFSSDITAQLIQACKQVMITPHHSRPAE